VRVCVGGVVCVCMCVCVCVVCVCVCVCVCVRAYTACVQHHTCACAYSRLHHISIHMALL